MYLFFESIVHTCLFLKGNSICQGVYVDPKSFWRSTTLEEVSSICQEIHDGMEYFLKRFRWNFGYSLDDVETFCRVQATAEAAREAKGPYQKWKLDSVWRWE